MRERNELILADLVAMRAEAQPDLDVLTFEHLSLDGGATPDEVRTYADLHTNGNRIAAELIRQGLERGERFAPMMRNHPEYDGGGVDLRHRLRTDRSPHPGREAGLHARKRWLPRCRMC